MTNKWTLGLAAVGVVSLASAVQAEEKASPVMTALSSTTISGYVNTSMQWRPGTGNANTPAYAFNGAAKADGFNLDVVKLTIERPLDEGQWAAGYKVDLIYGPDAVALGTGFGSNIKQAYVALRAPVGNGLDFKVGVWDTIIGYETFDAGSNPNYTRSYGYSIEPTTHTGVLASYQFCKWFSASVGIANDFGPTINGRANPPRAESFKTYMAAVALTAPDDWGWVAGSTLYAGVINGSNAGGTAGISGGIITAFGGVPSGNVSQTSLYVGSTLKTPIKGLTLGAAYDYAGSSSQVLGTFGGVPYVDSGYANAVSLYTSYQFTEQLSAHARAEYASRSGPAVAGGPTQLFALTGTLQYDLWKNVLSRLELRWDTALNGRDPFYGVDGGHPYGGNTGGFAPAVPLAGASYASKKNDFLVALNIIYKF